MQSLVLIQCLLNSLVAYFNKASGRSADNVPLRLYFFSAVSYSLAMLFSNLALEFINYPTQVLVDFCWRYAHFLLFRCSGSRANPFPS